jgi:hypothetical protein
MAFGTARRAAETAATRWRALAGTAAQARVWVRVLATALGVGALAGAGQLGVAYGLGLLHFPVPVTGGGVSGRALTGGVWAAQLTWVAWFAILAVLAGGAGGAWAAWRLDRQLELGGRIAVTLVAGAGAAVVVPLTSLPAAEATLVGPELGEPGLEVALAAGLGVAVGILAAVALLSVRLVAVSVTLVVSVVWLLALVSVAPSLGPDANLPEVRLAVLDLPALGGARSTVAVLSAPLLALLVCGAIALAARSRGLPPLLTAVASAAAPGVLALAYLIGSPGTGEREVQTSPYAGALMAIAVGLLASLAVGAVRLRPAAADAGELEPTGPGEPVGSEEPELPDLPLPPDRSPPSWAVAPTDESTAPVSPAPVSPAPVSPAPVSPAAADLPAWPVPADPPAPPAPLPEPASLFEPVALPEPAEPAEPADPADSAELAVPPPPKRRRWGRRRKPQPPAPPPLDTTLEQPLPALGDAAPPTAFEPPAFEPPAPPAFEPPAFEPPAFEPPAFELPAFELPVPPEPDEPDEPAAAPAPEPPAKRSRRVKLPGIGRKSKQPKEPVDEPAPAPLSLAPPPEPTPAAEPTSDAEATAPEPPAPATPPRRRRRREDEHVDWISSLAGDTEEETTEEKGRRRLRRDRDTDTPPGDVPDPPSWPANDAPDDAELPSIHRPYVSRDRPGTT